MFDKCFDHVTNISTGLVSDRQSLATPKTLPSPPLWLVLGLSRLLRFKPLPEAPLPRRPEAICPGPPCVGAVSKPERSPSLPTLTGSAVPPSEHKMWRFKDSSHWRTLGMAITELFRHGSFVVV